MDNKNNLMVVTILFFGLLNLNFGWEQHVWEKVSYGISESEITCLAFYVKGDPTRWPIAQGRLEGIEGRPLDQSSASPTVLIGTTKSAYRSLYKGRDSKMILQVSGAARRVNYLYASSFRTETLYAATDSGLFLSTNDGETWKRVFFSNDNNERRCLWVLENEKMVYLATAGGLFYKEINGPIWQKAQGDLNGKAVSFLASDGVYIYAATENKVFRLDPQNQELVEIFSLMGQEINGSASESSEIDGEDITSHKRQINFLAATNKRKPELYTATSKGIFYSPDQGESWEEIDADGLPLEDATSLAVLKEGEVVLGTQKGVFLETDNGWEHIYGGMETNKVNFLACDPENNLYAATDKGIFLMAVKKTFPDDVSVTARSMNSYSVDEPSIRDVQRMAIDYAEVGAGKIKNWRRLAQTRALMPEVSLDFDKTVTTALGSTYDRTAVGPQDWGVNLKWDMAELIWSSEQTSIDSRSKLMVELREDILDQVTRLYFERRRLQAELIRNSSLGMQEREDKEMRVEELTALIDGFTGGGFSKRIEESHQSSDVRQQTRVKSEVTSGKPEI